FFYSCRLPRALPSFPTRRSSDLKPSLRVALMQCVFAASHARTCTVNGFRWPEGTSTSDPMRESQPFRVVDGTLESPMNSSTSARSEEHTSELQSLAYLVCRLLLE